MLFCRVHRIAASKLNPHGGDPFHVCQPMVAPHTSVKAKERTNPFLGARGPPNSAPHLGVQRDADHDENSNCPTYHSIFLRAKKAVRDVASVRSLVPERFLLLGSGLNTSMLSSAHSSRQSSGAKYLTNCAWRAASASSSTTSKRKRENLRPTSQCSLQNSRHSFSSNATLCCSA